TSSGSDHAMISRWLGVAHAVGKGEAESSNLSGSTSFLKSSRSAFRLMFRSRQYQQALRSETAGSAASAGSRTRSSQGRACEQVDAAVAGRCGKFDLNAQHRQGGRKCRAPLFLTAPLIVPRGAIASSPGAHAGLAGQGLLRDMKGNR